MRTRTKIDLPRISFANQPGLVLGSLIRHFRSGYQFWEVTHFSADGTRAHAKAIPTLVSHA